ncbi:CBO0543 family protein [Heyndrickxia oleronia]|jgi:hypothetical protein|uniref:CBO0543 family protein n=1 Tax=Heyndrickxia oleronia TaxID=38875 RepID=UPI002430AA1B|nr:CBO0543 family protein [Heyndrickxia oleronia]MCI1592208.1 hypothetical protein [Heyndrickxia oleronia]MCI1615300.1 hypothetical protein [Heyndrickxia oleronia]MCI1746076.1 hypothetical protein [Heyndrickxia oleronia]MCI1763425.1 hypothetical protein [Heyndrickxia oleronia]
MSITVTVILLIILIWKRYLKNWKDYHATLVYVITCNLTYIVLCRDYWLWKYHSPFLSEKQIELFNVLVLLPLISLLYLSRYPEGVRKIKKFIFLSKWVIGSMLIEGLFIYFNEIEFDHGWGFWMELPFYFVMYTFMRLHMFKPLLVYALSVITALLFLWIFHVPV